MYEVPKLVPDLCHAFLVRIGAYLTISGLDLRSYGPRSEQKLEVWRCFRVG